MACSMRTSRVAGDTRGRASSSAPRSKLVPAIRARSVRPFWAARWTTRCIVRGDLPVFSAVSAVNDDASANLAVACFRPMTAFAATAPKALALPYRCSWISLRRSMKSASSAGLSGARTRFSSISHSAAWRSVRVRPRGKGPRSCPGDERALMRCNPLTRMNLLRLSKSGRTTGGWITSRVDVDWTIALTNGSTTPRSRSPIAMSAKLTSRKSPSEVG